MEICVSCRVEMRCVKTGYNAVWGTWAKRGDVYKCPLCDASVLHVDDRAEGFTLRSEDNECLQMEGE